MSKTLSQMRENLSKKAGQFVFWLLILQPILDAVSYFANVYSFTAVTTVVRFGMFAVICLYCFLMSDRKKVYLLSLIHI